MVYVGLGEGTGHDSSHNRADGSQAKEGFPMYTLLPRPTYCCDHCTTPGATSEGALWKTSSDPHASLYYLHSRCLQPYKLKHGLRSVEGRRPLAVRQRSVA